MAEQNRENGLSARCQSIVRDALLAVFGNEALFLIVALLAVTLMDSSITAWYRDQTGLLYNYIVVPWGTALCLLRLQRRPAALGRAHADVTALFVLYVWLLVPFAVRFGLTFNNMTAWYGYAVMYFGVYASISESDKRRRETVLATMSAASAVFAAVFCGALLYCAWTGKVFAVGLGAYGFGVVKGWLCSGVHYNITAMIAVSLFAMCAAGAGFHRNIALKLLHLIPAVMAALVIVLTQSRTSRYAVLAALAAAVFDGVRRMLARKNGAARFLAAVAAAAVVLVGGYLGANRLTQAAVAHYNQLAYDAARQKVEAEMAEAQAQIEEAQAEKTEPAEAAQQEAQAESAEQTAETPAPTPEIQYRKVSARDPAEAAGTFSNRTDIWSAVFQTWRDDPKNMLIGNGVGRTGSKIGKYIEWIDAVAVHNTYLQWAADFGLIGFAIQLVFLLIAVWQAIRVFFAKQRPRGALGLCMMVIAGLIIGLMESATLGAMTPINLMFMFALAQLSAMSRETADK